MAAMKNQVQKKWAVPFFTIWTGQAFSILGSQVVQFALIWWLTRTTGSATVLATASLVGLLPQVFISPFAGALVDRWNRRIMMIVADSLVALATLILAVLFLTGTAEIWHVYLLMFVRSTCGAFHWPAMSASTSLMVPDEHLARVQGANSVLNGGLSIAAAPLGALLLELTSLQAVLGLDVVTALIAVIPLLFIAVPQPKLTQEALEAQKKATLWQDMKAGFRYVWGWPGLLILGLMATLINFLFTPAFALLPLLVTKHFNGQAFQYATLESAWGVGVVIGGLALGVWGGFKRRIFTTLVGLFGMGLGMIVMGLAPSHAFLLAVGAIFFSGFFNPICNGPLHAILQSTVAPEMQGRVFTLVQSVASGMTPLGLAIAAPISQWLGIGRWFVIGGIITLMLGVMGAFIPALINIEKGSAHEQQAQHPGEDVAEMALNAGD